MKVLYEAETEALKFYGGSKNIIMNFCSYSQKSLSSDREYHMVLEFGERDLDEYFFETDRSAPVLVEEIRGFWGDLSSIASALKFIQITKSQRTGSHHIYQG